MSSDVDRGNPFPPLWPSPHGRRGPPHPDRTRPAGAGGVRPAGIVGKPRREPARVHRRRRRPTARRPRNAAVVTGGRTLGDRGRHDAGGGRRGGVGDPRRADRRTGHGVAARAVGGAGLLFAHGAQHRADGRLGHLRTGHHLHRGRHRAARRAAMELRPGRRVDHHPAVALPAGVGTRTAQVRHRCGGDRVDLPVRPTARRTQARDDGRHLVGVQHRGGHHRGGRRLLGADGRGLRQALAQFGGRVHRGVRRLRPDSDRVLRAWVAGPGHCVRGLLHA